MNINGPKRLIEVTLPIREVSAESVRDKNLHHAHIRNLHVWWARRPLAACRAVTFASLVPDPDDEHCPPAFREAVIRLLKDNVPDKLQGYWRGRDFFRDSDPYRPYPGIADTPRNRLLTFIAKWSPEWLAFEHGQNGKQPPPKHMLDDRCLVKWETSDPKNAQGTEVLGIARELIHLTYGGQAATVLDPFAGGGSIPLEASRLGCRPIANDYNPVAHLILRGTCEFPQKYGDRLAEDVEFWAKRVLERARERIGDLYPPGEDGHSVVGYLWARTAPCSNPTCRAEIPLLRSLLICRKKNKRVALTMDVDSREVSFGIAKNEAITQTEGTMLNRGDSRCPICQQVTPVEDLRQAGLDGKMGERMVAVITDTPEGKDYRPVEDADLKAFEEANQLSQDVERPSELIPENQWNIKTWLYGMKTWGSLFNPRQLLAMQSFVGCLREALAELEQDEPDSDYQKAVAAYLGLWVSRIAAFNSSSCIWAAGSEIIKNPFGRQAIPMNWDYPEVNPFADSSGTASTQLRYMLDVVKHEALPGNNNSHINPSLVLNNDAAYLPIKSLAKCDISVTDPPYFDQIAYSDLSDFFYIWLKRCLSDTFPELFATPLTPKSDEATALKHRHGGDSNKADKHFTCKLTSAFTQVKHLCSPRAIHSIMFAHQSTEAWTALINALFDAGLTATATYPIESELTSALKKDMSALASSFTVVCRPRQVGSAAPFRQVREEIDQVVAESVHRFFEYGFRGVDLIVACYGPAVGVFGRFERVERADGTPVKVPELLELAKEAALKAIAGEFQGDALSRLYFVWANLYGIGEQAWDDARIVVQIGGDSEDAMDVAQGRGLFVVNGSKCRLALLKDRSARRRLGEEDNATLIDQLHRAMLYWKQEERTELVRYLSERELLEQRPFWKMAQALFEVLPRDEEDWKLIKALLGERETLRREVRRMVPARERTLFEEIDRGEIR